MKTKKQRLEEQALAREAIRRSTTMPGILLIDWMSGRPTSTGRTDRYQIRYISLNSEGPEVWHLTHSVARALGYRLNSDGHVSISGYGYSKSYELAHAITAIAQKDLRVHADQTERVVKYDPTSHRAA